MFELNDPIVIWTLVAIVLMVLELVIPGGIVVFLGIAALVVAGAQWLSVIEGWVQALTLWFIASMVLLVAFRNVTQKLVGGEITKSNTEQDIEIYGKTATVIETIGPGQKTGRIEFQDSSWMALSDGSEIETGATVTIICHDNISLVVERTDPICA